MSSVVMKSRVNERNYVHIQSGPKSDIPVHVHVHIRCAMCMQLCNTLYNFML